MFVRKHKKLTPGEIKKIRELYANGNSSYSKIAVMFDVTDTAVAYHVNDEFRKKRKKYAREHPSKRNNEYSRNYAHERYNTDPAFRERAKKREILWRRKNKDKTNKYLREHLFMCKGCGRCFADPKSVVTRSAAKGKCHRCGLVVSKKFNGTGHQ